MLLKVKIASVGRTSTGLAVTVTVRTLDNVKIAMIVQPINTKRVVVV